MSWAGGDTRRLGHRGAATMGFDAAHRSRVACARPILGTDRMARPGRGGSPHGRRTDARGVWVEKVSPREAKPEIRDKTPCGRFDALRWKTALAGKSVNQALQRPLASGGWVH